MRISFDESGWDEYLWWQIQDRKILRRINALIADIAREPYGGIGKPEPLRHELTGFWSRRITDEHRLVYRVVGAGDAETIEIAQCRYHYTR